MKKFFQIFTIIIVSITSKIYAQTDLINPRNWEGWATTTDGFPTEVVPGKIDQSTAYIFDSPVSIGENGVINAPYFTYTPPSIQIWIARGGKACEVTAQIRNAPRDAESWKRIFVDNRYSIPITRDKGKTYAFAYNEPLRAHAYQIGYTDDAGAIHFRYEVELL